MVTTARPRAADPPPLPRWAIGAAALMAIANLLSAVVGGLVRLGTLPATNLGPTGAQAIGGHGAVMMAGFFGALIALERVVALRHGLWVPVLAALGGWLGWGVGQWTAAGVLWVTSAAGLVWLYAWAGSHRAVSLPLAVEASGALALLVANAAFTLGQPEAARIGWSAFLVLTIAGERRELTRLVKLPGWASKAFLGGWAGAVAAVLMALLRPDLAGMLWWITMALLAAWLLRWDVATRQWRANGWAGHTAICLLVGYVWLAMAAVLGLLGQTVAWHALWLGFVMAMVFGHAPIMLPTLAGWRPEPTRWALLPLSLLGASLALRVASAVTAWPTGLMLAGAGHALAFVLFGAVMVRAVRRGR
ncbi:hypothetical protein [Hydrogenophaga sp. RWCD_12]|uniref:hypothetical protein n=1 Tax=Hydrogenophaga sp. RWCD_12 TaxID=3391190 RepID=UPI0039852FCF